MELFFTPFAVFAATLAGFLVGAAWYSPLFFMKAWLYGEGITKSELPKRSVRYMVQIQVYSLIAHSMIASVMAIMFDVLSVSSLLGAVSVALLLTLGFIVTTRFIDMVYSVKDLHYELRPQVKFLVSSGYYLTIAFVMASVIFLVHA